MPNWFRPKWVSQFLGLAQNLICTRHPPVTQRLDTMSDWRGPLVSVHGIFSGACNKYRSTAVGAAKRLLVDSCRQPSCGLRAEVGGSTQTCSTMISRTSWAFTSAASQSWNCLIFVIDKIVHCGSTLNVRRLLLPVGNQVTRHKRQPSPVRLRNYDASSSAKSCTMLLSVLK